MNKKGFTLVEMLIAISLFTVVAVLSSGILIDVFHIEKKSDIQNALYDDLRVILQQITNEIQRGTIDYEEYYNIHVIKSDYFGVNYGVYGSRFFDPGESLDALPTNNPADLGVECSRPEGADPNDDVCEVIYSLSVDSDTGQNPFFTGDPREADDANALCDTGNCAATSNIVDELLLIDSSGTRKTIIAKKATTPDDFGIGLMRMEGRDLDQNGFIDTFSCLSDFKCFNEPNVLNQVIKLPFIDSAAAVVDNDISLPRLYDLNIAFDSSPRTSEFIPISPLRVDIKDLKFILDPIEDPYRAFAESSEKTHPTVTIIITVGLAKEIENDYPGEFEDVTVQSTVSAGVIGKIATYPPTRDVSWISDVEPAVRRTN